MKQFQKTSKQPKNIQKNTIKVKKISKNTQAKTIQEQNSPFPTCHQFQQSKTFKKSKQKAYHHTTIKQFSENSRNIKWTLKNEKKQINTIQFLPFSSIFIKKQNDIEENKNIFIHSNCFRQIFNKDNSFVQTLIYSDYIIQNRILNKKSYQQQCAQKQQNLYYKPNHSKINLSEYLSEMNIVYSKMNFQLNHNIFFYSSQICQFPINLQKKAKQMWYSLQEKQKFIKEHDDNSFIILFVNREYEEQSKKLNKKYNQLLKSQIVLYDVNSCQQIVTFQKQKELNKNQIIYLSYQLYCTFSITQNQMIVIFHKILFEDSFKQNFKQLYTQKGSIQQILKIMRKNSQQLQKVVECLKQQSFTRQYNYKMFYTQF